MVKPPKKLKTNLVGLCCVIRVKILNGSVWMKFLSGGNAPFKRIEFFSHTGDPITSRMLLLYTRIFLAFVFIHLVASETVQIGVLLPFSLSGQFQGLGKALELSIEPAIQDVYTQNILSQDWNITYTITDGGCSKKTAVGRTYELSYVDAFIGPACSDACLPAALLTSYWNKPMISYSCSSIELSDRFYYATFARTQPFSRTYSHQTPDILYQTMDFYNWTRAAIIGTEDNVWSPLAISLTQLFQRNNITLPFSGFYVPSSSFSYTTFLSQIKDKARGGYYLYFSGSVKD